MNNISPNLNTNEMLSLMKDFYTLTGMKIVLFNTSYSELIAYPDTHSAFCSLFQQGGLRKKCLDCNKYNLKKCRNKGSMIIYHCHAGLVEAVSLLLDNKTVLGYIMFGQVSDIEDKHDLKKLIISSIEKNGFKIAEKDIPSIMEVGQKTTEQIRAAAQILDACALYTVFKRMITASRASFTEQLNSYLHQHLHEPLTSNLIAKGMGVSRRSYTQKFKLLSAAV